MGKQPVAGSPCGCQLHCSVHHYASLLERLPEVFHSCFKASMLITSAAYHCVQMLASTRYQRDSCAWLAALVLS